MSVPCSKPLQHKSSPEEYQNLAEGWTVSSFSSPCFLTSLSESQLHCSWDLFKAGIEFYWHQEKSSSLWDALPSTQHSSLWQLSGHLSQPGFFITLRWFNWTEQTSWGVRERSLWSWELPLMWETGWWQVGEVFPVKAQDWGCLSFPWVLGHWLTCTGILGVWRTKSNTGQHNTVCRLMSSLLRMDINLFSMCFHLFGFFDSVSLDIAGGCRGKRRREKKMELCLIQR